MTFAEPTFLQLGAGLVLLTALGLWSHMRRRRRLAAFLGGPRGASRLSGTNLYRPRLERLILLGTAAVALALAAAGPVLPDREVEPPPPPPGRQIVFAVDVSASMQALDEAPSRLGRAVATIEELLPGLQSDRVGLVIFAGRAYPVAPPTHDHAALRYLLEGVTPTLASTWDPGSLPSTAIAEAARLFDVVADPEAVKTIVLISDGEAGETVAATRVAAERAAAAGITLHAVGVGSETGSPMSLTSAPNQLGGPVLDSSGAPAITRFRDARLREIATAGDGRYLHAGDAVAFSSFRASFVRPPIPTVAAEPRALLERMDPTALLAAVALVLLLIESLLDVRLPGSGFASARALARRST